MNLEKYNSFLVHDNNNAIFRSQQVIAVLKKWKLPQNLLDVGCGSGELLRIAKAHGIASVTGVDGVQDALDQCREVSNQVYKVDLNASNLPFQDNSFEVVTCLEVLEHLYAPQITLQEIVRVTTSGGRVLLSVPNPFSYTARLKVLIGQNISNPAIIGGHIKFFRLSDFKALCEACGLKNTLIWGLASPTAYKKYGILTSFLLNWMPDLFATWFFAFCEKPLEEE